MKEKIPNLITLANLASGFTSILFSVSNNFFFAVLLLLLSVVLDFFDGFAARKLKAESPIGVQLDSLADMVSFGVAPAVLLYSFYSEPWVGIPLVLLVLAGGYRLARYNATKGAIKGFEGMPITLNGILIPIIYFFHPNLIATVIIILLSASLMASKIHFKKVFS